jgi:hypothetical protein
MLITKNTILNCKNHVVCTPDTWPIPKS